MIIELLQNDCIRLLEVSEGDYSRPVFHLQDHSMVYHIGDNVIREAIKHLIKMFDDYVKNEDKKKEYPYTRNKNFMASDIIYIQDTASGIRIHYWYKSIFDECHIYNTYVAIYLDGDDEKIGKRLLEFERQINK